MRISDWSSDVCSSDLPGARPAGGAGGGQGPGRAAGLHHRRPGARHRRGSRDLRGALPPAPPRPDRDAGRSEEHTSELQSLMRISYAVFCLKKKKKRITIYTHIAIKIQKT